MTFTYDKSEYRDQFFAWVQQEVKDNPEWAGAICEDCRKNLRRGGTAFCEDCLSLLRDGFAEYCDAMNTNS